MFYEAFAIKNLLKCELCSRDTGQIDQKPLILPCCLKTICTECFHLTNHTINNIFKCLLCNSQCQMPTNGFLVNHLATEFYHKQPEKLCNVNNTQTTEMFYETAFIRDLLKCNHCTKPFDEYEEPKILPCCFKTLCVKCVHLTESSVKYNQFKCLVCKREDEMPRDGFLVNNLAVKLILLEPIEVYRGDGCNSFKKNLIDLDASIRKLSFEITNGEYLIKEHCNEQRRLIQLATEQRIQNIYTASDILIQRVNDYEKECMHKYSSANEIKQHLAETIKLAEQSYEKEKAYLDNLCINEQEILAKNEQLKKLKESIENEKLNAQKIIFTERIMEFEKRKNSGVDASLGRFKFKRIDLNLKNLLSCSESIKLWDLKTNECLRQFNGHTSSVNCVKPCDDYNTIISCSADRTIKVWDMTSGDCLKTISGHSSAVDFIEILSDDQIASCSLDKTIRIWSLETGSCLKVFEGHSGYVWRIKLLSNDKLISCSSDQTIMLWDLLTGECLKTFFGHINSVLCIDTLTNDTRIASGSTDKTIKIWDTATGECLQTLESHTRGVWCIQILSNDKIISGSFDNTLKIWSLSGNVCLSTLTGHSGGIRSIKILSNDQVASCSKDCTIKVWNLVSGECLQTIQAHTESIYFMEAF